MYTIFSTRLCRVFACKFYTCLTLVSSSRTIVTAMAKQTKCFQGTRDHYNGITVDSNVEFCETDKFSQQLQASIEQWILTNKRTIWFRVSLSQADWIPHLVKEGFKFHHAKEEYVVLYRWLPKDQESNIPPYAHTNIGVGAFVVDPKTDRVLVIKEKHSSSKALWKLPGGYVEPGEDIEKAAIREVLEETGIEADFKCLVAFRHGHQYAFGCSDIYLVASLIPRTLDIKKCEREILECKWMKVQEYANHPEVHENNKFFAQKMLEFSQHGMGITVTKSVHPLTKKPISVYNVTKVDS